MKKIFPILIILSLLLTSCGTVEVQSDKMQVYTSFYAMYDFARTIGGDDADIHNIVPTGTEPHDFEPTAADITRLSKADVFIYNGGIDGWAEKVAANLPETVRVVCASENLSGTESDPHIWLNFYNAQMQMELIYKAFSTADNENSQKYLDRMTEYTSELDSLKAEYENAGLGGKKLFVTHGAYGYLCEEFGMEQVALEGISGDSDPSPAQMAAIVGQIKNEGAPCIFYDPLEGDKMARIVASEADIEALPLYTFEGDGENRDYLTIMRENLNQLKRII